MTLEGLQGYRDAFFPQVHKARGHQGQIQCAEDVLRLVASSSLLDGDQAINPTRCPPQEGYSVRCAPQVIGAVRDVLKWVRATVEIELNAATDNPLLFVSEDPGDEYHLPRGYKAVSCGNFHGEPLAFAMDFLGIAIAELGLFPSNPARMQRGGGDQPTDPPPFTRRGRVVCAPWLPGPPLYK